MPKKTRSSPRRIAAGRRGKGKVADLRRYEVPVGDLRWSCDPAELPFRTTDELRPSTTILGQKKAIRALKLGLGLESPGYNIFICGLPGTGRRTTLRHVLRKLYRPASGAVDRVYVPRFHVPERPRLVTLEPGMAPVLKRDVRRIFARVQRIRDTRSESSRRGALRSFLRERIPALRAKYGDRAVLISYFQRLAREILLRDGEVHEEDHGVQVVVSRPARQRCPVLWPSHLTFSGLFGSFERHRGDEKRPGGIPVGGIRPGLLVEATGGYLVMRASDFLEIPNAWSGLKNCLTHGQLDLCDQEGQSVTAAPGSRPDPIPLDVKVILIGDYPSYDSLMESDVEFTRLFKVRVDFDVEVTLTRTVTSRTYPRVLARICRDEELRPLTRKAVAKVLEYAVRRAGRKSKISIEFSAMADLIREANFWAERRRRRVITPEAIECAMRENVDRLNLLETKLSEMISDGVILIDTAGSRVGQVNGLAVYDQGDYQFGKPSRITAETSMGHSGIINIERESGFSGRSHDKGIQILGGFLRSRFAQKRPLSLTASVCFEQSYVGIDGDSASSTEIYAILSSLSDLPIRQDIAVTGSLNQKGDIQPIGGVNEKIEGFFECVLAGKPTGREGVIIPRRNVPDLMLREDIVQAVKEGRFSIYAIDTVEQGIEILTGYPAGKRNASGKFSEGTVFHRADQRLDEMARGLWKYSTAGNEPLPAPLERRADRYPQK